MERNAMRRIIAALSLMSVMIPSLAFGQAQPKVLACPGSGFFKYFDRSSTPAQRREFAAYLADPLRQLNNAVPGLSPAEEEWLSAELAAPSNRRKVTAFQSLENRKQLVKSITGQRL